VGIIVLLGVIVLPIVLAAWTVQSYSMVVATISTPSGAITLLIASEVKTGVQLICMRDNLGTAQDVE
jgi:hypothetical protein